jgi:hypothetical protein
LLIMVVYTKYAGVVATIVAPVARQ